MKLKGGPKPKAAPIGQKFGRLTVLEELPQMGYMRIVFCRCDCGATRDYRLQKLVGGRTKSCGCFRRDFTTEKNTTHGMRHTRFWKVWIKMIERCRDPNNKRWHRYGGRGITVCEAWQTFETFKADMYESYLAHAAIHTEKNTTIDRVDNNGNYEPSNCRWWTKFENGGHNSRTVYIEHEGKTLSAPDWGRLTGIGGVVIRDRIKSGWSVQDALTQPLRVTKRNTRHQA